jgi:hypothetical protein
MGRLNKAVNISLLLSVLPLTGCQHFVIDTEKLAKSSFQILWVYYGLSITSRSVIIWNVIAVLINSLTVGAYVHFLRKEKAKSLNSASESCSSS